MNALSAALAIAGAFLIGVAVGARVTREAMMKAFVRLLEKRWVTSDEWINQKK